MRYSEAICKLEEDPTLEFKLVETHKTWTLRTDYNLGDTRDVPFRYILECDGEDSMGKAGEFSGNLLTKDDRWEVVRHSITWQEALEAWAKGRNVSVVVKGCTARFRHDDSYYARLSEQMINLGEWYIEEGQ